MSARQQTFWRNPCQVISRVKGGQKRTCNSCINTAEPATLYGKIVLCDDCLDYMIYLRNSG